LNPCDLNRDRGHMASSVGLHPENTDPDIPFIFPRILLHLALSPSPGRYYIGVHYGRQQCTRGVAANLPQVVKFYNQRFRIGLTPQQMQDLVNFLQTL
jgi:hypothetical protein